MKNIILLIAIGFLLLLSSTLAELREENKRLISNQELILLEKDSLYKKEQAYKIKDSLNAISISALNLKLSELERYYAEKLNTIRKSKADKKTVAQIIDTKVETSKVISIPFDSTSIPAAPISIPFDYKSQWTDISGYIFPDSISLTIVNRESLLIVKSLERKKFWFIKLPVKLFGYKNERIEVISENPSTSILNASYVEVIR